MLNKGLSYVRSFLAHLVGCSVAYLRTVSLRDDIKAHHILRLQKSECTVEHGFVLSDILTNLERVSDHCSNIAGCLIEMSRNDSLDLHDYLHRVKAGGAEYDALFAEYKQKYALPSDCQ